MSVPVYVYVPPGQRPMSAPDGFLALGLVLAVFGICALAAWIWDRRGK